MTRLDSHTQGTVRAQCPKEPSEPWWPSGHRDTSAPQGFLLMTKRSLSSSAETFEPWLQGCSPRAWGGQGGLWVHGSPLRFREVPGVPPVPARPGVPAGTEGPCPHRDLTENPLTALPTGSFLGFIHLQSL